MTVYPIRTRRWTRAEYDRLIADGCFRPDERLELLGGQLVVREPQSSPHAVAIVALDLESEPEPDLSVVGGDPRGNALDHPADPVLIVEVAKTSLVFDREQKGSLYARAGIADYWIINLVDRQLEVYRDPVADPLAPFGWRYAQQLVLGATALVSPLAAPSARVSVADLLP